MVVVRAVRVVAFLLVLAVGAVMASGGDDVPSENGVEVPALLGAVLTAFVAAPVSGVALGIRLSRFAARAGAKAGLAAVTLAQAACAGFMPGMQFMYSQFANQPEPKGDLRAAYLGGALCLAGLWFAEDVIVRTVERGQRTRPSMQ